MRVAKHLDDRIGQRRFEQSAAILPTALVEG
jgi:hypothetical protein